MGTVEGTAHGTLCLLRLPDDPFVIIKLVDDPALGSTSRGTGISHLVTQVESLDAAIAGLAAKGIAAERPGLPGGADGPRTSWITDRDDHRIELVRWPAGHAGGITKGDFA